MAEYIVADSGKRHTYASGMNRDVEDEKPRFDLLRPRGVPYPEQYLTRIAVHLAKGAKKYGARNWESGWDQQALDRAYSSAARHFEQWLMGADDGEDHAAAIFFNVMQVEYLKYRRRLATYGLEGDRGSQGSSDPE